MRGMKKRFFSALLSMTLVVALAGCGSSSGSEENGESMTENIGEENQVADASIDPSLEDYYLVTNMYGDGQKPWYIVLTYNTEVDSSSISTDDFEVEDYEIENVFTNAEASLPEESTAGNYVLIELSTDYTTTNYGGSGSGDVSAMNDASMGNRELSEDSTMQESAQQESIPEESKQQESMQQESTQQDSADSTQLNREDRVSRGSMDESVETDGVKQDSGNDGGRGTLSQSSPSNQFNVTFQQTGNISFSNGTTLEAAQESCSTDYNSNVNLLVENFSQYTFTLSDGSTMMYSLYLPENYDENTTYPLVLFMPDATGEGSDAYLALTESLGGVIWTTEEWQSEHECIVLVPQYESANTEDPALTMELVTEIVSQYSVDTSREYLVGQSSGTIRSIKLFIDYPNEFAGGLLVAGQTDSAYTDSMADLAEQNIWMICSEGDARAYPGMTEITDAVEAAGTEVTTAQWAATLTDEEQEQLASEQASEGTTINWTIFDAETVMRDDVTATDATEHMNTWRVAYDLDTVREWLFEQVK